MNRSSSLRPNRQTGPSAHVLARRYSDVLHPDKLRSLRIGARLFRLILVGLSFCIVASAQHAVEWQSIDGGGGTSSGGIYTVTGTIGQPDTAAMNGGNFTVVGGYWSILSTIQTPGAPMLTLMADPQLSAITISWPLPAEGWVLQEKVDLTAVNWVNNGQTPQEIGGRRQVAISPLAGSRFYRLYKP